MRPQNSTPQPHTIPNKKNPQQETTWDIPRQYPENPRKPSFSPLQPYSLTPNPPEARPYARPSNLLVDHTLNHPRYEDCRPAGVESVLNKNREDVVLVRGKKTMEVKKRRHT